MADEPRSRLGRGLAALIGESNDAAAAASAAAAAAQDKGRSQKKVPTEFIKPNPRNPRKVFHDSDLEDLTNSIREKGIIQPILVRANSTNPDLYELIAGERRWRAAQKAGIHEVPVIVVDVSDQEALEIAIIENLPIRNLTLPKSSARAVHMLPIRCASRVCRTR
jgi:ParB family chromosome partitioning protein